MNKSNDHGLWTIPNLLTMLRIVLIPVFVLVFYLPFEWARIACTVVFGLAGFEFHLDKFRAE